MGVGAWEYSRGFIDACDCGYLVYEAMLFFQVPSGGWVSHSHIDFLMLFMALGQYWEVDLYHTASDSLKQSSIRPI